MFISLTKDVLEGVVRTSILKFYTLYRMTGNSHAHAQHAELTWNSACKKYIHKGVEDSKLEMKNSQESST